MTKIENDMYTNSFVKVVLSLNLLINISYRTQKHRTQKQSTIFEIILKKTIDRKILVINDHYNNKKVMQYYLSATLHKTNIFGREKRPTGWQLIILEISMKFS